MRKQAPRALVPWWALPSFETCLQKHGPHTLPVICHSHLAAIDAHRITRHGGVPHRSSAWLSAGVLFESALPMQEQESPDDPLESGWSAGQLALADGVWEVGTSAVGTSQRGRVGERRACPRIIRRTLVPSGEDGSQRLGATIHARASGITAVAVQGADDVSSRSGSRLGAFFHSLLACTSHSAARSTSDGASLGVGHL
ncbi:hypothetical protein L1887_47874 [Cichorium endivia]|nr:hypothetical protein L1887_47874 [Cichorium endivia]